MNKRVYAVFYMFCLTLVFTSLVTVAKVVNEERIAVNQQANRQRVILTVLKISQAFTAPRDEIARLFASHISESEAGGRTIYSAHDPVSKEGLGHAFALRGIGFWGPIEAMVGVDAELSRVLAIEFYRHQETPGLGARITEPWFTEQFAGLSLVEEPGDEGFFTISPPAPDKPALELDAVTGATLTTRAVETFVNQELQMIKDLGRAWQKGEQ
ncbi:MAG: FMN-binding protein [Thermodesulfobacteriota bacterium]